MVLSNTVMCEEHRPTVVARLVLETGVKNFRRRDAGGDSAREHVSCSTVTHHPQEEQYVDDVQGR